MRRSLIVFTSEQEYYIRIVVCRTKIGVSIDTDRKMKIPLPVYFQLYVICYGELVITFFKEIVNFCIALFIFMSNRTHPFLLWDL